MDVERNGTARCPLRPAHIQTVVIVSAAAFQPEFVQQRLPRRGSSLPLVRSIFPGPNPSAVFECPLEEEFIAKSIVLPGTLPPSHTR